MPHGFFFTMGGFVSADGHHPIVRQTQLQQNPGYVPLMRGVRAEDIKDKSKGDGISKGFALVQGLWFMTQTLSRIGRGITQLEVATLAFQIVTFFVWLLWWDKPLDVQQPILLQVQPHIPVVPPVQAPPGWRSRILQMVVAVFLGGFPDFVPDSSTSVPALWSTHGTEKENSHLISVGMQTIAGTLFGATHFLAWNAHFPTPVERKMWRGCSVFVTVLACALTVFYIPMMKRKARSIYWTILDVAFLIAIPVYIAARLVLIGLPFSTLRDLPPVAFALVQWTKHILHI
jgi:hypothetical protein